MYKERIADILLDRKLQGKGAVLIEGPKWCGKTTTAKQKAKSVLDLGNSVTFSEAQEMFQLMPQKLLSGKTPRLIDEWQLMPRLWDMVRSEVDQRQIVGQFVLIGSSVPPDFSEIHHSGTGRFARLRMRTMSLWESGESTGQVSLGDIFENKLFDPVECDTDIDRMAYLVCRGGWPQATLLKGDVALAQAVDYFDAIYQVDIHRVDKVRRSSERTRAILRSYARNQGSPISLNKMSEDIKISENQSITYETISSYVDVLANLFVVEDMLAWNPNLRSKTAIQSMPTRYFADPSIATAALGLGPKDLINDLSTFGLLFETMAVRDLRVYADALDGQLYHFRDAKGLECDAVLHRRNGTYGLIEIKLGGADNIEKGAKNLLALSKIIDTDRMKAPAFMMVLTAVGNFAYRRPDGVFVVPITCLRY